jgi:uncharacterized membrane protein YhaH (DUF805 family)
VVADQLSEEEMDGLSFWHLVTIIAIIVEIIPIVWILHRAGLSGWWAVLIFIPLINLIALWAFAIARWPNMDSPARSN